MTDTLRARRSGLGGLPASLVLVAALAGGLGGCGQLSPGGKRSSEFFPSSKYGPASERVVRDGERVPRGGGRYLVGRPYTIAGKRYVPREVSRDFEQVGNASWYGAAFHGRRTANGEVYDMRSLSAAHPTMPLPSYARVTNLNNRRSIIVRVNDRGPFHGGRVLDVSQRVADALDFRRAGTARVKVEYVGKAGLAGSDDALLLASLTTDGTPAQLNRGGAPGGTMVAQSAPAPAAAPAAVAVATMADAPEARPQAVATNASAFAPLPPLRPFDLSTIPGADTPLRAQPLRRSASFFAPPSPVAQALIRRGPFDGVDITGLRALR